MSLRNRSKALLSRLGGSQSPSGSNPPALHPPEPDFLCIGAKKGGTRWLYDALRSRDDTWLPPIKELHYFDGDIRPYRGRAPLNKMLAGIWRGEDFQRPEMEFLRRVAFEKGRQQDFDWYGRLFDVSPLPTTGEVTPAYSALSAERVQQIADHFPRLKIIFLVRHPVDRFWSHVSMACRTGEWDRNDMTDPEKVLALLEDEGVWLRSMPTVTINNWSRAFDADHFATYLFDDIRDRPEYVLTQVSNFLGLDTDPQLFKMDPRANRKANREKLELTPLIRAALYEYFSDEIDRCIDRLGGPTLEWAHE